MEKDVHFFKDETLESFRGRIERRELSSYYDTDDEQGNRVHRHLFKSRMKIYKTKGGKMSKLADEIRAIGFSDYSLDYRDGALAMLEQAELVSD